MNVTSDSSIMTAPPCASSRAELLAGLVVGALAVACTAWGAHGATDLAVLTTVAIGATAVIFGVVVPRALRASGAGGTALWLSLPAIVSLLPLFWSGLPLILGAGGVMVGLARRHDDNARTKAVAGLVLGSLAVIGYVGIYLVDGLLLGNI